MKILRGFATVEYTIAGALALLLPIAYSLAL